MESQIQCAMVSLRRRLSYWEPTYFQVNGDHRKLKISKYQLCVVRSAASSSNFTHTRITVNKNSVPNDPQSPFVTSGIRIGTPAATTRGFGENECKDITHWICDICDDIENPAVVNEVRAKVEELCSRFPVYK